MAACERTTRVSLAETLEALAGGLGPWLTDQRFRELGSWLSVDLHFHCLHAAHGQIRQLSKPLLDIRLSIVRLEISFAGEHLIEDEMTRRKSILLQEVDEVFWIAAHELDKRQGRGP